MAAEFSSKNDLGNKQEKKVKYPFNGIAFNLIDKFLVLGYDQKLIDNAFKHSKKEVKVNKKIRYEFFTFQERPAIINDICNDYSKELIDNDLISGLIFPQIPEMYFLKKKYINTNKELEEQKLIKNYSIIFSLNPQDDNNSKKSYNGLGYIFYVQKEHKTVDELEGVLYVPTAYVILSEFPYFYHFKEICDYILKQMKKESDEIPMEILLYNIIKFMPSPINKSINLSFLSSLRFPFKEKGNNLNDILAPLNIAREKKR